ncbi:MAG: hypothetical protein U0230_17255 [Polyangiales bacterium]
MKRLGSILLLCAFLGACDESSTGLSSSSGLASAVDGGAGATSPPPPGMTCPGMADGGPRVPPPPLCATDADCVATCETPSCLCTTTLEGLHVCASSCANGDACPDGHVCLDAVCRPAR